VVYCFDIDGTICIDSCGDYANAVPLQDRLNVVNKLYDEGHRILFFTARGATTGIDWRSFTLMQLKRWGVKFHELHMGKPHYDFIIDDKGVSPQEFFSVREMSEDGI
jgi:hypothetical protein